MRGGIDTGDHHFRPRLVGVVWARNNIQSRDVQLSSPCCAGSMESSQSVISQWSWGFRNVRGGVDPGDHRFRPRIAGVVGALKDF